MPDLLCIRLPAEREQQLLKYIKERRYPVMIGLFIKGAVLIAMLPMLYADIQMLIFYSERHIPISAGIQLAIRYSRTSPGTFVVLWIAMALVFLFTFFRNFGKKFGPGSDYSCVRHMQYCYEVRPCGDKFPDAGKHPYYVCDEQQTIYTCPVYIDYKNACPGEKLLCIHLDNGRHYAFLEKENDGEWWNEKREWEHA